ncbi:MAG: tRNA (guanosine(37)-N1)-methyltransferase TrmD [Candidatus Brocadiales bacterium]
MRIDILTLFPEVFPAFLGHSILGIAQEKGLVEFHLWNIRDFSQDKHKKVDDRPFGGGPGMVLRPEPIFRAIEAVEKEVLVAPHSAPLTKILLSPQGTKFNQSMARELTKIPCLMFLCGHYEGFDERVRQGFDFLEVSIGDYVLSGGEVPAMVIIDAIVRLIPGALGDEFSAVSESFGEVSGAHPALNQDGSGSVLLEYPQYTRPREFRGMGVPEVLLSGDHEKIKKWRLEQAETRTRQRRPDLLKD